MRELSDLMLPCKTSFFEEENEITIGACLPGISDSLRRTSGEVKSVSSAVSFDLFPET